jgi:transposase InsO family protein
VSRYVDEHRDRFGVEPICKTLGVSVSAYYQRRRGRPSVRAVEAERLLARIRALHAANDHAYGYRWMWKALRRAGEQVPLIADRVWRSRTQLELAVVEYIGWYNAARLHESLGDIPPLEYEQQHGQQEPITLVGATV